jgi:redox-sensitive bicupin YhaK (pirin superfamily)
MRFIQMWIMPRERGLEPAVEQKVFSKEDRTGRLLRIVSPEGGEAVLVHQDAGVYVSLLPSGSSVSHKFGREFGGYLYLIEGAIRLNGEELHTGDAAKIEDEPEITVEAEQPSELIMVEVRLES